MRDNYRREYKKLAILKVHDNLACSSWVHFNSLEFLEKVHTKKQLQAQSPKINNDETIVIESSDDDFYHNNYKHIKHKNWHNSDDEIVHFFKSIAPYLAMMDSTMRLRVRIEIQEIILNELSRKIDAAREKIAIDLKVKSPKRASKRIVTRNRKYL